MNFYVVLFFCTIVFIIWAEYSVGNIFLRINSSGKKMPNFSSLFNFMGHPFHSSLLWTWNTLDINYAFIVSVVIVYYFATSNNHNI